MVGWHGDEEGVEGKGKVGGREGGRTLSCGMEGTRRWVVCRWEEKVRDLTWERRMASLGFGLAAVVRGARRRRRGRRVCVGVCILVRLGELMISW